MPRTPRLGQYADIIPILDAAISAGGGSYTVETHGAAVHWMQRANRFRKLYAEHVTANSKYDCLILRRILPNSCMVTIDVRETRGVFVPAQAIYNVDPEPISTEDDLLDIAETFAKRLRGPSE